MIRRLAILALVPICAWLGYRTVLFDSAPQSLFLQVAFGIGVLILLVSVVAEMGDRATRILQRHEEDVRQSIPRSSRDGRRGWNESSEDRRSGQNSTA